MKHRSIKAAVVYALILLAMVAMVAGGQASERQPAFEMKAGQVADLVCNGETVIIQTHSATHFTLQCREYVK